MSLEHDIVVGVTHQHTIYVENNTVILGNKFKWFTIIMHMFAVRVGLIA